MAEYAPETWRKTKDCDGVVRIWSNRVTHAIAHALEYPGQDAVADLIVAAPETARQRDKLLKVSKELALRFENAAHVSEEPADIAAIHETLATIRTITDA